MLQVQSVTKSYGTKQVFCNVSFSVSAGERLAVYGPNGVGKSTLLRILSGEEDADSGSVVLSPPSSEIGYLAQGYAGDSNLTVGNLLSGRRPTVVEAELTALADQLSRSPNRRDDLATKYERALQELASIKGGEQAQLEVALKAWELQEMDPERPVGSLSGGEQTRLGLARLFVARPQVLLLDEPTNHLDLDGIERLEAWLQGFKGAVVLVTHDRALLASIATSVLELTNDADWRLFAGSYTTFLETKERELTQRRTAYGRQERDTMRIRDQIRRLKERARRTEAATTNFYYRKRAARVARQAKVVERRLQRFLESEERVDRPKREAQLRPDLAAGGRAGDDVLLVDKLAVTLEGHPVLRDVTFGLRHGERCALIGRNGSGKTTLLRTIAGEIATSTGRVRLGACVSDSSNRRRRRRRRSRTLSICCGRLSSWTRGSCGVCSTTT